MFLPEPELRSVGDTLVGELKGYREQAGVSTAVLGMSGGVDSALTAALLMLKRAGWRVIGFTLPIEQNPQETERGAEACHTLGLEHMHLDLSEPYRRIVAELGGLDVRIASEDTERLRTRRGNVRARLRMITLFDQAHCFGRGADEYILDECRPLEPVSPTSRVSIWPSSTPTRVSTAVLRPRPTCSVTSA